jgi:hypothetical protein
MADSIPGTRANAHRNSRMRLQAWSAPHDSASNVNTMTMTCPYPGAAPKLCAE